MVKLKYSEVSSFAFAQAMEKISNAPVHGTTASKLHKVTKALTHCRQRVTKEYQADLVENFGKKDEAGKVIRPEGEPLGFEIDEPRQAEFGTAQEAFGDREVELDCPPITDELIADMKVSAKDLEALRDMYIGNRVDSKPALPKEGNVQAIR